MVHAKLIAREVFGIIGNVFSFGLFASSVPTFDRVTQNKPVEESEPEYFLLTMMNCFAWLLYGMPFITPGSILVLTANSFGLVIHLAYLIIFLLYAKDHRQRICAGCIFLLELALVGLVSGLVIRLAHTYMMRAVLVGAFGFYISAFIFICRLSPVVTFWVEGSLESKSFLAVLSSTLHDLCWLIYASFRFELFLMVIYIYCSYGSSSRYSYDVYCAGFFVGVVQLVQYGIYYKSTPKSGDDKVATAEVQLQIIDTGDDKKLAVVEAQLQDIAIVIV